MIEKKMSQSLRLIFSGGAAIVGLSIFSLAQAQDAAPGAPQLQRVEVTGSLIRRADVEGALPVQTVTHEDIQKLGVTTTDQLLSTLSSNTAVGAITVAEGVGASTYGESTASLRGIGASKTLVLVNGRRLANYATDGTAVDVNSIPLAAVDHVEILKDGASGVYGSDAIGGVINFILRNNFTGVEINGYSSGTKDGGGQTNKASIIAGWGDFDADRYNVTVSADVGKDDSIYGSQRSYAQQSWIPGVRNSSATPSGAVRTFVPNTTPDSMGVIQHTFTGSAIGNPLAPGNCAANGSQYSPDDGTCRFNPSSSVPLVPEVKRANLAGSFRFKLNDSTEAFMEGFHSHQLTTTIEQPSPYSVGFMAPDLAFVKANVYPAIIMQPTSPFYPAAYIAANQPSALGKPITVSYRAFDGGGREHQDTADQNHLVLGVKGTVKNYDYEVSYTHNSSNVSESTQGGYQSMLALAELLSNNNAFNPFAAQKSPALAAQIKATNYNGPMMNSVLTNDSLNARISGDLYALPAGEARFAFGGTLADENLNLNPSAAFQSGDISGYGSQALPLSASRNSSALYGELNVPIVKGLESDLAVRTDKYPNATATNPKVSLRYQPISQILLRGSYGRGFREPSLPELNNPQVFGTTATFVDPKTGVNNQFNEITGGNTKLSPEKSEQSSLGFVIDPIKGLSISVDYWKIKVRNLVTTLDPEFIVDQEVAGNPTYAALVKRDAGGDITQITSTNINAGSLKTEGIDLDARYKFKTASFGTFGAHLNGTYVSKYDETLPDGTVQPSVAATIGKDGNPLNAVAAGGIIFRWKDTITFDWQYKDFGIDLTNNFQSGYYDAPRIDSTTGLDGAHVGAFSTWDLQGSYTGVKNLTLRVGVKNLGNRLPPQVIGLGTYFQAGYDPTYYDAHGQTGYVTATYKF